MTKKTTTTLDTGHFKKKLETEFRTLETELKSVGGHRTPGNPKDWQPAATDVDIESSDLADTADNIENFELNTAILKPLEIQYNDVKLALDKIKKGTYGLCEVDGKPIEKERLEAMPSARTCLVHHKSE